MGDGCLKRGREVFDDVRAENRLAEPRGSVDPQQFCACGEFLVEPVLECGPVEDPIAGANEPLREGVMVAFIWGPAAKPGVEFPSRRGFAPLA